MGVVHVVARLVPLLDLAAQLGFLDVAERLQLPLGLRKPRLRILQRELLLLALHAREKFARHGVQLGPPDVVAGLRHVRLCLLLLNAVLRARLADFFFGLFVLGAPVVQRALDGHRIELDDDIAFLDGHAVGGELEDLKVAATRGRYRQRNRTHRLHFAAHLQVVDELAFDDGGGRHLDSPRCGRTRRSRRQWR